MGERIEHKFTQRYSFHIRNVCAPKNIFLFKLWQRRKGECRGEVHDRFRKTSITANEIEIDTVRNRFTFWKIYRDRKRGKRKKELGREREREQRCMQKTKQQTNNEYTIKATNRQLRKRNMRKRYNMKVWEENGKPFFYSRLTCRSCFSLFTTTPPLYHYNCVSNIICRSNTLLLNIFHTISEAPGTADECQAV